MEKWISLFPMTETGSGTATVPNLTPPTGPGVTNPPGPVLTDRPTGPWQPSRTPGSGPGPSGTFKGPSIGPTLKPWNPKGPQQQGMSNTNYILSQQCMPVVTLLSPNVQVFDIFWIYSEFVVEIFKYDNEKGNLYPHVLSAVLMFTTKIKLIY